MIRHTVFVLIIIIACTHSHAQHDSSRVHSRNLITVLATEGILYAGTMTGLNHLWYADYPRSSFHWINDNNEWCMMDKAGHSMTSYYVGKMGYDVLQSVDANRTVSLICGGGLGFIFLASVEVFDGFSAQWGASWGDLIANTSGTFLFVGQELLWKEQRFGLKYSFHQTSYSSIRPEVLGSNLVENMLKDYNGQTYWLTCNISSFLQNDKGFPKWINVALGYSADGMLGGYDNNISGFTGVIPERLNQYYLSLDIALSKLPVKNKYLKKVCTVVDFIKIPFPAIELSSKNHWSVKPFYF